MPEAYQSDFMPRYYEDVVTYVPEPEPQIERPQVVQKNTEPTIEQIAEESNAMAVEEKPIEPQVVNRPVQKEPQPVIKPVQRNAPVAPTDVFEIMEKNENNVPKDNIFDAPIMPTTQEKQPVKKDTPISKLNDIMAKMEQNEKDQKQKVETEEKQKQDRIYNTFQSPMMNPAFMQYGTGMPGVRPMDYGPPGYGTNMLFPGQLMLMMGSMSQQGYPYPMANYAPQVPTVFTNIFHNDN
jgi:hypothetical protein